MLHRLALGALALTGALSLAGCGIISFEKPRSVDEIAIEQSLRSYYTDLERAFAVGNAEALAQLYSPSITDPMTQEEIRQWAEKFFADHGRAQFHPKLEIDQLAYIHAQVTVTYTVQTPDGKGSFSGTEVDTLARNRGRWAIVSWKKVQQ